MWVGYLKPRKRTMGLLQSCFAKNNKVGAMPEERETWQSAQYIGHWPRDREERRGGVRAHLHLGGSAEDASTQTNWAEKGRLSEMERYVKKGKNIICFQREFYGSQLASFFVGKIKLYFLRINSKLSRINANLSWINALLLRINAKG